MSAKTKKVLLITGGALALIGVTTGFILARCARKLDALLDDCDGDCLHCDRSECNYLAQM